MTIFELSFCFMRPHTLRVHLGTIVVTRHYPTLLMDRLQKTVSNDDSLSASTLVHITGCRPGCPGESNARGKPAASEILLPERNTIRESKIGRASCRERV